MAARAAHFNLIVIALILTNADCSRPRRTDYRSFQPIAIEDASEEADRVWESIQEALRRQRFRLDRVDRRAGVITTFPGDVATFLRVLASRRRYRPGRVGGESEPHASPR